MIITLLYNIVSNSYKYTIKGHIHIELFLDGEHLVISVADTGNGIPDHILLNWGKPFNNLGYSEKGTGLGQFIIERISQVIKVKIPKPETKVGKGTVVKILFPLDEKSTTIVSNATKKKISQESLKTITTLDLKVVHIIVLDDAASNVTFVDQFLKKNLAELKNIQINIAKTYRFSETLHEVSRLFVNNKFFDFILLDFNIEENINGMDVANIIHQIYSKNNFFDRKKTNFFFLTEESDLFEKYHLKYPNLIQKDRIFSRTRLDDLCHKIKELLFNY
jgi:anti-sigma regulatory factor (Ser/Thr protein kinase)